MSPSEIAFLAFGLMLGAAIGAVLAQVGRARPARREVRLTITPNAIPPRRAHTLSVTPAIPAWSAVQVPAPAGAVALDRAAAVLATGPGARPAARDPGAVRTRVPSGDVILPPTAVAVPVGLAPESANGTSADVVPAAVVIGAATAVAVLEAPGKATVDGARTRLPAPEGFVTLVRPGPPVQAPRPAATAAMAVVARPSLTRPSGPTLTRPTASGGRPGGRGSAGNPGAGDATDAAGGAPDPCAPQRRAVDERCALAEVAREQAGRTVAALREAQRAYDVLRDRVDHAEAQADPRQVAAAKERLHAAFRAAGDRAASAEETEAAARAWLTEINALNTAVRDAQRVVESGTAELRSRVGALERLSAEADAARIAAENADGGCREAREELAGCEEADARAREAVPPPPEEPHPFAKVWPEEIPDLPERPSPSDRMAGLPLVVRVLRGDRDARERVVATLAGGDADAARDWGLRIARLADAITGRAIEDGYLELPEDHPFWRLFSHGERRDIVGALSALGFRFDGMGGFADGRAPAARDLSLAVGYAGLDRMRIRTWPRDTEIALMYERAVVASDEWLADQAGDLSLGSMVDALGNRAADLAELWNAWGRVRPALLAT